MYGILTLTLILWQQAESIRIVDLQVPGHAAEGGSALLGCQYDLEGEELYSVKWYKDGQEFYRYVPSNTETISYFPMTGVMVDISRSSSTVVALETLRRESAGLYRCEVSGEAPYFVTAYDESAVNIHLLPKSGPHITGLQPEYRIGELLAVNCSSGRSRPRAQVSWQLNGRPAPKEYVRGPWVRQSRERSDAQDTTLELSFVIAPEHFEKNGLILQCQSSIAPLYQKDVIQQILRAPEVPMDEGDDLADLNIQIGQNFVIADHGDHEMVIEDHSVVLKVPIWTLVISLIIFKFI
ncbi:uncharacterized protein LOC121738872 [Aricia agestis]|uniref:uncharacterized protein LOC121738872 n=1 Tax=Aricia agestis TaxID=91739 RepID=UPI001C20A639|nr:uncharacterized protein LOC121738872 [Aricia agestis]